MPSRTYPIAETFTSVQGEGVYTGTLMHFIRLAGCNVGKYEYDEIHQRAASEDKIVKMAVEDEFRILDKSHSICTSVLGQRFLCDTNYHKCYDATAQELMEKAGLVEHICITGGEPFLHDLEALIEYAAERLVHIETSGTKPIQWFGRLEGTWITCSPKAGYLSENTEQIDEFKFVVSSPTDIGKVAHFIDEHDIDTHTPIYLQPINWVDGINQAGIDMVVAQLEHYPTFRLSAQLHKYLGVR